MLAGPLAYLLSARRARAIAGPPASRGARATGAAAVGAIDLDGPLAEIDLGAQRRRPPLYGSLHALARIHGDPLAMIEMPAPGGRVTAAAQAEAVWTRRVSALESHAASHGCIDPARP